jgi:hypothetical protein
MRAAYCKALALGSNSAGRRWLERSIWRTSDQDRRAPPRRVEVGFNQSAA